MTAADKAFKAEMEEEEVRRDRADYLHSSLDSFDSDYSFRETFNVFSGVQNEENFKKAFMNIEQS